MARLWVQTTVTTVAIMTIEDERGCVRSALIDDHEKVPIDTMIMIATSAGIGIRLTQIAQKHHKDQQHHTRREGTTAARARRISR